MKVNYGSFKSRINQSQLNGGYFNLTDINGDHYYCIEGEYFGIVCNKLSEPSQSLYIPVERQTTLKGMQSIYDRLEVKDGDIVEVLILYSKKVIIFKKVVSQY